MFEFLARISVTNRLMVVLALIGVVAGFIFLVPRLSLDAYPDVTNVQVVVNAEANGLAAEEVEQLITYPIEAVMYALPDVTEVRSISKVGLSTVTVVFKEGIDIYFARQLVFERLQAAKNQIPDGMGDPQIGPNSSGLGQVFQYTLRSKTPGAYDLQSLRALNDWSVKLMLLPAPGVTEVLSFGGEVRQYQVKLDPNALQSYALTGQDVIGAVQANNVNAGGWYIDRGQEQLVVRGVGWVRSDVEGIRDISNIPVRELDTTVIRVRDVATVEFGPEIRQGAVTMNQRNANGGPEVLGEVVTGIILKAIGANTKKTIEEIKARLPIIQAALPVGVIIEPFYDQSSLVNKAVHTVTKALSEAFVLISIVLFLFLLNLRATLIVLISIPLSIALALIAMSNWGVSANLMSLGGLAIAIGMIVDGSVVMVEHVFTSIGIEHHKNTDLPMSERICIAASEIGRPVFFAVAIIIIVFMPLFTLQGVEGKLFKPMAISISFAMLASLFSALIVAPALATYFFRQPVSHRKNLILHRLIEGYHAALNWTLEHKRSVVLSALGLFVVALMLIPQLGTEFIPELEEGTLNIRTTMASSINLDTAIDVAERIDAALLTFPEVDYATRFIGRAELGGEPEPLSNIETYVGLKPIADWKTASTRLELQKIMQEKLEEHPGLLFSFSQPIAARVDELLSGVKAQLAIKLFGPQLNALELKGREIESLTRSMSGASNVAMEQISGEAQLVIRPDRDALSHYGIAVSEVMDLINDQIGGAMAGQVINGNERYDIVVRLAKAFRSDTKAIRELQLSAPNGAIVPLGDVASVVIEQGPPQIRRDDVQRRVVIQANVQGRDLGGFVTELQQKINSQIKLPASYSIVYGGQFENQQRAQARLMVVVPLSLGLIFLLLYFAFGSIGQSFLIMLNVPLAMIGGVIALFFSGQYLSVPASIGFIALFGIAVLNGVVLVSAINQRLLDADIINAIKQGALSRLRPVLMTALIAALGLIPMLLSSGVGSEVQRPLATVVVGGLFSSTALTLFVLPALFATFSGRRLGGA
jgi:cobalt-zinc-cadmium resistance protein CzcA